MPGHRRKEYCCDAHRQAALRLRKRQVQQQEQQGKSANVGYFLEKIHSPRLRGILEDILQSQGEVALLRLIVAITEEREQAQASDEAQQRMAYLEIQLSEYRKIVDLQDRDKICQQFMAIGQLLGYRRLDAFHIGEGEENWKDYRSWTDERTLAEIIIYARELLSEEAAVKERTESRSKVRQAERQLTVAQAEIQELRLQVQQLEAGQAEWMAWKEAEVRGCGDLTAMRGYLQKHLGQSIPLKRNGVTVKIVALGDDAIAVSEDHGMIRLNDEELQQGRVWVCKKTDTPIIATWQPIGQKHLEEERARYAALQDDLAQTNKKITSLERQVQRYERMKVLRSRESMLQELMVLGGRLKYASLTDLEIGEGIDQWLAYIRAGSSHDLAMAIAHGYYQADSLAMAAIEASDSKLQMQMRAAIKDLESDLARRDTRIASLEQPQLVDPASLSELPALLYRLQEQNVTIERLQRQIGELEGEGRSLTTAYHRLQESHGSTMYQMNILLARAQSEIGPLRRELDRYLPPPRAMLECTLRRWSTKVTLPYDELKADRIDQFLQEASERKLLHFIEWSQSCYFIGKRRRQRIAVIQEHISELEPYRGDPALTITGMDDQGYVIFANGDRRWQDTDSIERFWARIVGEKGQQTVGGNADVARLQQYLYDHPGASILIQQGNREYQIVVIADDGLGITHNQRLVRLYEDDIEQARQWIGNRDTESTSRLEHMV